MPAHESRDWKRTGDLLCLSLLYSVKTKPLMNLEPVWPPANTSNLSCPIFPGPWIKCLRPHLAFRCWGFDPRSLQFCSKFSYTLNHLFTQIKLVFFESRPLCLPDKQIYQLYPSPSHQLVFPLSSWMHCLYLCARFPFHVCIYPWVPSAGQLLRFKVNERSGLSS